MWWFNLLAGAASLLGFGFSIFALLVARSAGHRVREFERHEESMRLLPHLSAAKLHARELLTTSARELPRTRCRDLAEALAELTAAEESPPWREERERVRLVQARLKQARIANSAETKRWLGELPDLLATIDHQLRSAGRRHLKR